MSKISQQQFRDRWGQNELLTVPGEILQSVYIPTAAKDFLMQVGLPRKASIPTGGAGNFAMLPATPSPKEQKGQPKYSLLQRYEQSACLAFGSILYEPYFGHDTYFCIEEQSGVIRMLDDQDTNVYFINSSLPDFAQSLLAYRSFIEPSEDDVNQRDDRSRLRSLKRELRAVDPKAIAGRNNYWSVTLADLVTQL